MKDNRDNGLLLSGIIVGTFLLIVAGVTAFQSSAQEIFAGVCSLLGGAIGAGGAAVAVFLTLRGQQADERNQTLISLYLEVTGYLRRTVDARRAIADLYWKQLGNTANQADTNTRVMLRIVLNMPPPIHFQANVSKLARLTAAQTIKAFYDRLTIMRQQKSLQGMENVEITPNRHQLGEILLNLGAMMDIGIALLELPDFAEIQPTEPERKELVESLKNSLIEYPVIPPRYRQP